MNNIEQLRFFSPFPCRVEPTAIMYLPASINHFRSPDRHGYRPLARGLKSYRFLVRSIRSNRDDIFLFFFFLCPIFGFE